MKKQLFSLTASLSLLLVCFFTTANAQAKKSNSKPTTTVSRSVSNPDNTAAIVTITINKLAFRGHASIEENFSADLQATVISGSHASFHSANGKATFDWDNISEDKTITVSYSLRAIRNTSEDQTVSGHLSYQNQTFDMPASSFKIKFTGKAPAATANNNSETVDPNSTNTLQDLYYIIFGEYPGNSEAEAPASTNVTSSKASMSASSKPAPKHTEAPKPAPVAEAPKPVAAPAPVAPAPIPVAPTPAPAPPTNPAVSTAVAPTSVPAPAATTSSSVVYRVQIAAVPDKSKADGILKQYKITDQPYFEVVSASVTRVMVGNYSNLNDAKARIAELKNNGLTGAYVAPYYKGKRVSLTEAASHTQQ
ncbi:MAG TPA: SPOR domain-containing protein [Bacteroidia bacterium]|nr:SPOR domain-containing protein [Bacteroidia bacterium]